MDAVIAPEADAAPTFTAMSNAKPEDWARLGALFLPFARELPKRVLGQLEMLHGGVHGFPVDRLEHCLQTATRAARDGRDDEYVVCALTHDLGDLICPYNHTELATALLRPFVSDANLWMVEKHGVFQKYFYGQLSEPARNARDQYAGHPFFDQTAEFCALYDQVSFDPNYQSLPLEAFAPALDRVLGAPRPGVIERVMQAAE